ncbi:MAG TPA: glycosyltransferase [Microvirga sp.]|jgi:glycosyltransferase involved in cell wall biosynthesis|nr:glycosyltransferase [Microvirga sp.]
MRVLFVHNNFPGQYRRLASFLHRDPSFDMMALTLESNKQTSAIPTVRYKPHRPVTPNIHPAVANFEGSIINAQNAFQALINLKEKKWRPDLICGHSGFGPTLFLRELWPDVRMLTYFEWFYNTRNSDVDFVHKGAVSYDQAARLRARNATFLVDFSTMDWGVCPTRFQHSQLPKLFRDNIEVLHDGVDTEFFAPSDDDELTIGSQTFRRGDEVLTYATRGMEPYRGFPQFMEALEKLQRRRPNLHTIIVGKDRVAYGDKRRDGKTYKEYALETLKLDLNRIHFTDLVSLQTLRSIFRVSSVHVYLTVPFVLSWSMIEAMSTGVLLLGSDTAPVREVVTDGFNGLLVDFFDPDKIASRIGEALDRQDKYAPLREAARRTVLERYDADNLLPCHRQLMMDVANGTKSCR